MEPLGHTTSTADSVTPYCWSSAAAAVILAFDRVVGISVALEEVAQAQHRGRLRIANQDRARRMALEETDPPQDQRADDALAEIGLRNDQRAQLLRRNEQRLERVLRIRIDSACRPDSDATSATKWPRWRRGGDADTRPSPLRCVTTTVPSRTTNMPGAGSPAANSRSPGPVAADGAELADACDLAVGQHRVHLVLAGRRRLSAVARTLLHCAGVVDHGGGFGNNGVGHRRRIGRKGFPIVDQQRSRNMSIPAGREGGSAERE